MLRMRAMSPAGEDAARELMALELGRIVADAKRSGDTIRAGYHAGMLFAAYPKANYSIKWIIEELTLAAKKANVPIEIRGRGDPR